MPRPHKTEFNIWLILETIFVNAAMGNLQFEHVVRMIFAMIREAYCNMDGKRNGILF